MRRLAALVVGAGLVLSSLGSAGPARAASTFNVTRTDDPVPNGCALADCSLREAVIAANADPGSTVNVPAGTYTLTQGPDSGPATGDLDVTAATTIQGAGIGATIVQAAAVEGTAQDRVLEVSSAGTAVITNMTMRYGSDPSGGCVKSDGMLTLDMILVTNCSAITGGGVGAYGSVTVRDSTISNNTATAATGQVAGGGIAGGPGSTVTILRTLITNNSAVNTGTGVGHGGGFSTVASMTLTDSTVTGNSADSSAGGISSSTGTMTIERTTFSANLATRDGGGMTNDGVLTLTDSTFANNQAGYNCAGTDCDQAFAGGLLNTTTATADVINSTFSGNTCRQGGGKSGGGVLNAGSGTMRLYNSTIVGNECDLGAGLTSNASGLTYVKNTIISGNTAYAGGDCSAVVTSRGYNIIGSTKGCSVIGDMTGNISTTNPKVGPLADNGGPTQTRALEVGSPAVNAGDPAGCTDTSGTTALTTDQRGFLRPTMGRCDIGAYERQTSVVLWSNGKQAMAWQLYGGTYVPKMAGLGGPGADWTAQSYSRNPDTSFQVLWTRENQAAVWWLSADNKFQRMRAFGGPGAGWKATSVFFRVDGGYEVLWTTDNAARVWTFNSEGVFGSALSLDGPGPGWRATSYARANDNTRRVMWTTDNKARIWTLSSEGALRSIKGLGGPGAGWTATSYNLNGDGTSDVVWTSTDSHAAIWTLNADGTFKSLVGMGIPSAGWRVESYFFK